MVVNFTEVVSEIKKLPLLQTAKFQKNNKVKLHREIAPQDVRQNERTLRNYLPFGVISDVYNEQKGYASNRSTYVEGKFQLTFYAKSIEELDEVNKELFELMPSLGYVETMNYTGVDPETYIYYLQKQYKYQK